MKDTRAALRYAKALLNLANESDKAEELNQNMLTVSSVIEENNDLSVMLNSPVIKAEQKKQTLLAIFGDSLNNISKGLINQLVDNKRLAILEDIAKNYTVVYEEYKGNQIATVTSAVPLNDALKAKVLEKVKSIVGKEVQLENKIDPSIIGGFVLRVGDKQYDASITGKLNNLRREFDDNNYVSKL